MKNYKFPIFGIFFLLFFSCNGTDELNLSDTDKLILVLSNSWEDSTATVYLLDKKNEGWKSYATPITANIGKKGLAWGLGLHSTLNWQEKFPFQTKREGDKKSPAGVFTISEMMSYVDQTLNPNLNFTHIHPSLIGVDDSNSKWYNQIIDSSQISGFKANSFETMKRNDDCYKYLFTINHNSENRKGAGSLIFFHIKNKKNSATAGCTAVLEDEILKIIPWLNSQTLIIQLPKNLYKTLSLEHDKLPILP